MRVYPYHTSALSSLLSPFVRHSNMLSKTEKSDESPAEGGGEGWDSQTHQTEKQVDEQTERQEEVNRDRQASGETKIDLST